MWVQSEGMVIEKDLGVQESIVVRMDQIIGLADGIKWEVEQFKDLEINSQA